MNRTAYVGTHRATCDVPPAERRRAIVVAAIVALWVAATVAFGIAFVAAHDTPAAPVPLTLTADPGHWTPTSTLDTSQVEAGEPVDVAALYAVLAAQADAGTPDVFRPTDPDLDECVIALDPTNTDAPSVLVCSDGTVTAS